MRGGRDVEGLGVVWFTAIVVDTQSKETMFLNFLLNVVALCLFTKSETQTSVACCYDFYLCELSYSSLKGLSIFGFKVRTENLYYPRTCCGFFGCNYLVCNRMRLPMGMLSPRAWSYIETLSTEVNSVFSSS